MGGPPPGGEPRRGDRGAPAPREAPGYAPGAGGRLALPLAGRPIPVVADPHVDPDFGTRAVKVNPAHDPDYFEIGQHHVLPIALITDEACAITAHPPFAGSDRCQARPPLLPPLRQQARIA